MFKNVSTMTKAEAKECLTELGVHVHPEWTSLEMKSRITEVRKAMSHGKVKLGVTSSSRKRGDPGGLCLCQSSPHRERDQGRHDEEAPGKDGA